VAIVGHSGGGFIVSSYPGRYHDVVAMVQANAPSGIPSTTPAGNAAIVSATAAPAHGAQDDVFGPIGDASHDGPAPAPVEGYDYAPGPARAPCEEFDFWRAGADRAAATALCNPAKAQGTPTGETGSYATQALQVNPKLIAKTGKIPVLLAGADHDGIMPGDANALELSGWREHCGCSVSQFILKNTGHAFMAHTSLPTWVANVTRWLKAHHITPAR
jgi:pimeloyl-ACP methyl ester carboxylesterase